MAKPKMVVAVLMTSTVLSVASQTLSSESNCLKPHVKIFNSNGPGGFRCHSCGICPQGTGLSVNCSGEIVDKNTKIMCVDCVDGKTFSSRMDHTQCIPCRPTICDHQEVIGKCLKSGDQRTCKPCAENTYYSEKLLKCKECVCLNMTESAQRDCAKNGFDVNVSCRTGPTSRTTLMQNETNADGQNAAAGLDPKYIIMIVVFVIIMLALLCYCLIVIKRCKQFRVRHNSRWPNGLDQWTSEIFCSCCEFSKTPAPAMVRTNEDGPNGQQNGGPCPIQMNGSPFNDMVTNQVQIPEERPAFKRLLSEPVTSSEKESASNPPSHYDCIADGSSRDNIPLIPLDTVCRKAEFKVIGINADVFLKMCFDLEKDSMIRLGLGLDSLAGRMGYSQEDVESFKRDSNPASGLFHAWSERSSDNNVWKLIELLREMKLGYMADTLQDEVNKVECRCEKCLS